MFADPSRRLIDDWIVVGSSPSAPTGFLLAMKHLPAATTICCNAAIDLFRAAGRRPDYYWLSDQVACRRYQEEARWVRSQGGILATSRRDIQAMRWRGVENADLVVELPEPDQGKPIFVPGKFVHAKFSGLACLQVAVNAGARIVAMVGMDGYASQPGAPAADSFDGRPGKAIAAKQTAEWIGPFVQSVIDVLPTVEFRIYGRPRYPWRAGNLTVIECG